MAEKKKGQQKLVFKQFTIGQFIALCFGAVVFLTGVGLIITNYIGNSLEATTEAFKAFKRALESFNSFTHTSLGFLGWGIIVLLVGAVIIAFALSLSSKIEDRERERKSRRELRLQALKESKDKEAEGLVVNDEVVTTATEE